MKWLKKLDPIRLYSFLGAVFIFLAACGATWLTEDIKTAVLGLVSAVIALVAGEAARPEVVPMAKVLAYVDEPRTNYPTILPGEATPPPGDQYAVEIASAIKDTPGRHSAPEGD